MSKALERLERLKNLKTPNRTPDKTDETPLLSVLSGHRMSTFRI